MKTASVPSNAVANDCWGSACSSGGWRGRQARVGAANETPRGGAATSPSSQPWGPPHLTEEHDDQGWTYPRPSFACSGVSATRSCRFLDQTFANKKPNRPDSWSSPGPWEPLSPAQSWGSGPSLESVAEPAARWGPSSLPPFSFLGLTAAGSTIARWHGVITGHRRPLLGGTGAFWMRGPSWTGNEPSGAGPKPRSLRSGAPLPLARALLLSALKEQLIAHGPGAGHPRSGHLRTRCPVGPCLLGYGSTFSLCLLQRNGWAALGGHCCRRLIRSRGSTFVTLSPPEAPSLTYWAWDSACEFWELDIQMAAFWPQHPKFMSFSPVFHPAAPKV